MIKNVTIKLYNQMLYVGIETIPIPILFPLGGGIVSTSTRKELSGHLIT